MEVKNNLDIFVGHQVKLVFSEPGDIKPKALTAKIQAVENGLIIFESFKGIGCIKADFIIAIKPLKGMGKQDKDPNGE